jgi:hypothetical protein
MVKMNPEKGQKLTQKLAIQVDYQGMLVNVTGKSVTTVKDIVDGVFTLTSESKEMVVDLGGGQTMEQPDSTVTVTQKSNGQIIKAEGDQVSEDANRLLSAFNVFYPEKGFVIGEKVEMTIPADSKMGTREMSLTYVAKERKMWKKYDVLVLEVTQAEKGSAPISLSGTAAVDIKTGFMVMADFKFKNMPQMGMLFDGSWKAEAID